MNNIVSPNRISTLAFGYITALHEEGPLLDEATHLINGPEGTYRIHAANAGSASALEQLQQERQLAGIVGVLVRGESSAWIEVAYVAASPEFMRGWREHLGRGDEAPFSRAA